METPAAKKTRTFRSKETIFTLLNEYKKRDLSIKAFCVEKNIAQASFHNWKKKYSKRIVKTAKPTGFASLKITPPVISETPLFAEVKEIRIYQWVTAVYLKELLA